MRLCIKCHQYKSEDLFYSRNGKITNRCIQCVNEYSRSHYRKNKKSYLDKNSKSQLNRKKWLVEIKKSLHCKECGENHIACLDFHHNDPSEKEHCVSTMLHRGISKERILKEIDKCIVLCSNCHRKLHYEEFNNGDI